MDMNEIFYPKMKAFRLVQYIFDKEEFAEETGISKTYVQNVEKGKANPDVGNGTVDWREFGRSACFSADGGVQ